MTKVSDKQRYLIVNTLLTYIEGTDEEQRDLSSLGLKKIVQQLPSKSKSATILVAKVSNRLVEKVIPKKDASQGLLIDSLDIATEIFERFTPAVQSSKSLQTSALDAFFGVLAHSNAGVRKRGIMALSALGPSAASDIFTQLCSRTFVQLQKGTPDVRRTMVQLIGTISKTAPRRIGRRLPEFVPAMLPLAERDEDSTSVELFECCLLTFEQLLVNCAPEMTRYLDRCVSTALNGLTFDPNYAGDTGDDDDGDFIDDNFADSDDELDLEDYGDDDDNSWKVRRASAMVLEAAIEEAARSRHPDQLAQFANKLTPALVARISEREVTVRISVFKALIALVQAARQDQKDPSLVRPAPLGAEALKRKFGEMEMNDEQSPHRRIISLGPTICKGVDKELVSKNMETRTYCISLLRQLILLQGGGLDDYVATFLDKLDLILKDANTTTSGSASLKVDLLGLLTLIFDYHPASTYEAKTEHVLAFLVAAIEDNLYKVSSAGLLTTASLVASLKTNRPASSQGHVDHGPLVRALYFAVIARLERSDADQAIRAAALRTLGVVLANAGMEVSDQFPTLLPMLLERLRNETTRETTIKLIVSMRFSDEIKGPEADAFFSYCIKDLTGLLHHAKIEIKAEASAGLAAIIPRAPSLDKELASDILSSLSFEPVVLPASLKLIMAVLSAQPESQDIFIRNSWPQLRKALQNQALLATTLTSILEFFSILPTIARPLLAVLLDGLFADANANCSYSARAEGIADGTVQVTGTTSGHMCTAIAKAIGALLRNQVPKDVLSQAVATCVAALHKSDASSERFTLFGLTALGEIGRWNDLITGSSLLDEIVRFFESELEDVRRAAGVALGGLALGNLTSVLPVIETHLSGNHKDQALALQALKELIVGATLPTAPLSGAHESRVHGTSSVPATTVTLPDSLFPLLVSAAEAGDQANTILGAECLGRLALTDMLRYLPQLIALAEQSDPKAKVVALIGLRFTLTEPSTAYDTLLASSLPTFLNWLSDRDHEVRREAVLSFTSVMYNKPHLLRDTVGDLIPLVYEQTLPRAELQRSIPMGMFTMVIDDGLDLRKGAFDALLALLDSYLYTKIDLAEYTDAILAGLNDADASIRTLCGMIIARLTTLAPEQVAAKIDVIASHLTTILRTKAVVKKESTQQDNERASEAQGAVFRTAVALGRMVASGVAIGDSPQFTELMKECGSEQHRRAFSEVENAAMHAGFASRSG